MKKQKLIELITIKSNIPIYLFKEQNPDKEKKEIRIQSEYKQLSYMTFIFLPLCSFKSLKTI